MMPWSPAITTLLVVASVSQAARMAQGSIPALGPSRKNRSTISSEIRSQILSGCPSETDSLVNKYSPVLIFASPQFSQDSVSDIAFARDYVRFIVEPKPVVFPQHLLRRFQISTAHHHFGQPLVFNLSDVGRIVPGCDKRRRGFTKDVVAGAAERGLARPDALHNLQTRVVAARMDAHQATAGSQSLNQRRNDLLRFERG